MDHTRHLNDPIAGDLKWRVTLARPESPPIRVLLQDGIVYRHPAREEVAIVWAPDLAGIYAVLEYHYHTDWHWVRIQAVE